MSKEEKRVIDLATLSKQVTEAVQTDIDSVLRTPTLLDAEDLREKYLYIVNELFDYMKRREADAI